jgi:hypothetical protein
MFRLTLAVVGYDFPRVAHPTYCLLLVDFLLGLLFNLEVVGCVFLQNMWPSFMTQISMFVTISAMSTSHPAGKNELEGKPEGANGGRVE